jgi:DNA-binding CsgD family transcriptional regulator
MGIERDRLAEDLLSFAQFAPTTANSDDLIQELMKRVEPWGVTHVAAGVMSDASRNFKLGPRFGKLNHTWANFYVQEQLYRDDPVMDYSLRAEKAGFWEQAFDIHSASKPAQRVLSFAADMGARDGYMAPIPLYNGDIVIVSFQGDRIERHPDVAAVLRGLSIYYGVEGHRLVTRSDLKSGRFSGVTTRQLQVLHLAALGQRNIDIAHTLGIHLKTVEMHLARARARMGAANTKEAIALVHAAPEVTAPLQHPPPLQGLH